MSDYISKHELTNAVWRNCDMQDLYLPIHFLMIMENLPAADVVERGLYQKALSDVVRLSVEHPERKHGKWIVDRAFGNDVMSNEQMVICSVCHKGIFWGKQDFCPNCGADMRGDS